MTEPMRTRRWTRREYDQLVESGFFREGDRVELLAGQLMVAEPQGARHMAAIHLAAEALRRAFGDGWYVRVQGPIALDDESEPEPDLAVVAGGPRDHATAHPAGPALVVEVAEWSLATDRRDKAGLYARSGVADYWIVNLPDGVLEVHRDPGPAAGAPHGWTYRDVQRLPSGERVFPLAAPFSAVAVADLLP
jgi:Uma2 family endonuclease